MNTLSHKLITYTVFSKHIQGGNPAGIVPDCDGLTPCQMQNIAKKAGFSETVFISYSDKADYNFRYFTPAVEVPACGHATLAGLFFLKKTELLNKISGTLQTKGGIIHYRFNSDLGLFYIKQPVPKFGPVIDSETIAHSLTITTGQLNASLPIQKVNTGLWDIIIPVKNKKTLMSLNPDFEQIKDISLRNNAIGYHVFALDDETYHAFCRNFAPAAGISEEAATGTASGALAAYLYHYNTLTSNEMIFRQGESLNRPSEIHVILNKKTDPYPGLWVGGYAIYLNTQILTQDN